MEKSKQYVVESDFICGNFRCVVIFNGRTGNRCGYVGIPKDHRLAGAEYDAVDELIDVHMGFTYSGDGGDYPVESDLCWIGFDCAHYGDAQDWDAWEKYFPETYRQWKDHNLLHRWPDDVIRTQRFCEDQCRYIVRQLLEMEGRDHE